MSLSWKLERNVGSAMQGAPPPGGVTTRNTWCRCCTEEHTMNRQRPQLWRQASSHRLCACSARCGSTRPCNPAQQHAAAVLHVLQSGADLEAVLAVAAALRGTHCHPVSEARQLGRNHVHVAAASLLRRGRLAGPQVLQQLQTAVTLVKPGGPAVEVRRQRAMDMARGQRW